MSDIAAALAEQVRDAAERRSPLRLVGNDSKAFYGHPVTGDALPLNGHRGVVRYEPTELVVTARAGTPVNEVESLLADNGQMLAFEPPSFAGVATLGGAVASGLGGPRRPWGGAPRDLLLGMSLLDGRGRVLRFGGEVMKNVAGYDVTRLMAGALGTLGALLEVSVKVLPAPKVERNLVLQMPRDRALALMRDLARQPAPLSGAAHFDDRLYLRLSGNAASVTAWERQIGGDGGSGNEFWRGLRDHTLAFSIPTDHCGACRCHPRRPVSAANTRCSPTGPARSAGCIRVAWRTRSAPKSQKSADMPYCFDMATTKSLYSTPSTAYASACTRDSSRYSIRSGSSIPVASTRRSRRLALLVAVMCSGLCLAPAAHAFFCLKAFSGNRSFGRPAPAYPAGGFPPPLYTVPPIMQQPVTAGTRPIVRYQPLRPLVWRPANYRSGRL